MNARENGDNSKMMKDFKTTDKVIPSEVEFAGRTADESVEHSLAVGAKDASASDKTSKKRWWWRVRREKRAESLVEPESGLKSSVNSREDRLNSVRVGMSGESPADLFSRVAERLLVIGAGDGAYQVAKLLAAEKDSRYEIIGFLDDDPAKAELSLAGVPVIGRIADLEERLKSTNADKVMFAIPSAGAKLLNQVTDLCFNLGVPLMTLPYVDQLLEGTVRRRDLRNVSVADLLGRRQVDTDVSAVLNSLNGRRVLITGAGGSIGSEIARQVHKFSPAELICLDRDESALHAVQIELYKNGLLDTRDMVLCDIRDEQALREIFLEHRPEVVFHTAALKHLPMLENYPVEGWKTNVLGTLHLLNIAVEFGVRTFVNISTDKAADPTSVLGRSKRIGERLTAYMAQSNGLKHYCSVRFGNVLGSRGSMIWTFRSQIEAGGPLTITHPEVERYFMTIPEACQLVLQASVIAKQGEVAVLDMGEPIKIIDVAKRMIRESGKDIDIVFTGLRPGEKLSEVLQGTGEEDYRPYHPLISHMQVPGLDPADLSAQFAYVVGEK